MAETRLKIAVFIDFDNIEIGVKNTLNATFDVGVVLEALRERGDVVSKTAYGDWTRAGDYSRSLTQHATKLVQRNLTPGGDKNGADINLALDALEMAFTHPHINAYVIVGGDSDFISLVEKLKQYDKQIFVVGGRSFTSQVMQRNCHEFVAYENLIGRRGDRGGRGQTGQMGSQGVDSVVPLVRRALKVLSDREVTPQLGLLKSTLLQLDSTFSERTYGAGSFRDFAEKLAAAGVVTLKENGRNVLVELRDGHPAADAAEEPRSPQPPAERHGGEPRRPDHRHPQPHGQPQGGPQGPPRVEEAVAEVRRLFAIAPQPPRWPMYLRQVKQFLRSVDSTFDERKFGFNSLNDLLRACQREGLLRMERDRQGVIRFFQGNAMKEAASAAARGINQADIEAAERLAAQAEAELAAAEAREAEVIDADVVRDVEQQPTIVDAEPMAVEESAAAEAQPEGDAEAESAKPARRKAKGTKGAKEPKEARPRKAAGKPRTSARKKAVAVEA
jgi:uncharacterized LabA/DUF88 family protein